MLIQDTPFSYHLYCHPDWQKEKLPLIIFLHGAGERGDTPEELPLVRTHGIPKLLSEGCGVRCVAVSPQCPKGGYWATKTESLLGFIDRMIEKYNADPDRVSLTGISMGGFGTWFTALSAPEKFSCIAPVCGGGMPWAASTLKMPIRAFHGDKDTVVSPSQSIDMIDQAQKTNPDALLTLYHNVGHNSWDYAYTDGLIAWLISNSRK
jgi:predicted peptidase